MKNIKLEDLREHIADEIGYVVKKNLHGSPKERKYGGSDDDIIRLCYEYMRESR